MIKNTLLALLLFTYPVIVYFGLNYIEPGILAAVFAVIFVARYLVQQAKKDDKQNKTYPKIPHLHVVLITVLVLLSYSVIANSALALKFYPVIVSLSFFAIFSYSLYHAPSVVEIIASFDEQLDAAGIIYTRKVTQIWCLFFILNAIIATYTIFTDNEQLWLLYNGLISYILMGSLMAVEFVVRHFVKKRNKNIVHNSHLKP